MYFGLYTMIEDVSDEFLDSQCTDDSGNLYKPEGEGAMLAVFDETAFEKASNEDDPNVSDVTSFIDALNAARTDAEAWRARLETTFDVDNYLTLLALSQTMVNWDAYGFMTHNYYLH